MRACRKLNYAHDEEDLVEMANATEKIWWNNFWHLFFVSMGMAFEGIE